MRDERQREAAGVEGSGGSGKWRSGLVWGLGCLGFELDWAPHVIAGSAG
jgi:hypothetical protein